MSKPKRANKRTRRLIQWGSAAISVTLVVSVVVAMATREQGQQIAAARASIEGLTSVLDRETAVSAIRFDDHSTEAGIDCRHFPGTRTSLLPEDMGSGLAVGDYDGDGDEDVYVVNFAGSIHADASRDREEQGANRLYANRGDGTFVDVTDETGVGLSAFGMGAAWGDYDNDGDLDLYVTNYGPNVLYRNDGTRFRNVTDQAGVGDAGFSSGCAWGDYDRDGHIDLYVCSYVDFVRRPGDRHRTMRQYGSEIPYTLNPSSYEPVPNRLYRNNGDGTFRDVAGDAGVADPDGRSLGAVWMDMDLDGWIDLYVANDISVNAVFHNEGDGTFTDIGASSLAADYRGAMGLAVDDYDQDCDLDLLVTHWIAQENALYENMFRVLLEDSKQAASGASESMLVFFDIANQQGLGQSSIDMVGWAAGFVDFDNDGWADVWIANGSTMEDPENHRNLVGQPMLLYAQRPGKGFFEIDTRASPALAAPFVGRGGVQADFDRDGRWDMLLLRFGHRPLYLQNVTSTDHHWIDLDLRQRSANTQALGAIVELTVDGATRIAQVGTGPSYLSQHSSVLHFGLGEATRVERMVIRWPDGTEETRRDLPVDRMITLVHEPDYQRNRLARAGHAWISRR